MYEMGTIEIGFWCIVIALALALATGDKTTDTHDGDRSDGDD